MSALPEHPETAPEPARRPVRMCVRCCAITDRPVVVSEVHANTGPGFNLPRVRAVVPAAAGRADPASAHSACWGRAVSGESRTAVVTVLVHEPLEIDEPEWCAGHSNPRSEDKVDISHTGPEHVIAPDGRELFRAFLTQAPFSNIDRTVGLYIEEQDVTGTYRPTHEATCSPDCPPEVMGPNPAP